LHKLLEPEKLLKLKPGRRFAYVPSDLQIKLFDSARRFDVQVLVLVQMQFSCGLELTIELS
jgi:hypothetical protein